VDTAQEGCVMIPIKGAGGAPGSVSITFRFPIEVHPDIEIERLLYVPAEVFIVAVFTVYNYITKTS